MPASVVKTKKDEEYWERAREAAAKAGLSEEEDGDAYWRYVNGVFHRMKYRIGGKKLESLGLGLTHDDLFPLEERAPLKFSIRGLKDGAASRAARARRDFEAAFERLKDKHKKGELVPSDVKQVIHILYRIPPEHIAEETWPFFQVLRFALFAGVPFLIHPALGLIGWLTDKVIEEKVNERYEKQVLRRYRSELEWVEGKLRDDDLPEERKKDLKRTRDYLKQNITRLENYYESVKKYKDDVTVSGELVRGSRGEDSGDDDDDFSGLDEGAAALDYDDRRALELYKESVDALIEALAEEDPEWLSESTVRHAVRSARGKLERIDRKVSRAVDSVADSIIDGNRKGELQKMRKEIVDGRAKVSTILKRAIALGTVTVVNPAIGVLTSIAYLARKGWLKKRERDKLIFEIKNELEILEEKIKDAEADNDKKKKYQYIRLRNKLRKTLEQLRFGQSLREE